MAKIYIRNSQMMSETKGVSYTIALTWIIENYKYHSMQNNQVVELPAFQTGPDKAHDWRLKVKTKFNDFRVDAIQQFIDIWISVSRNMKFAAIKIKLQEMDTPSVTVNISAPEAPAAEGARTEIREGVFLVGDQRTCMCNDSLRIYFKATVSLGSVCTFNQSDTKIQYEKCLSKFNNYLSSLLENEKFSDYTIIVGRLKFPVHRAILAANCDYFRTLFSSNDFKENASRELKIQDFEPEVVKGLLHFLYTRQEPNFENLDFIMKLFQIADKYFVPELKAVCKSHLISLLTDAWDLERREEVLDFLRSADPEFDERTDRQLCIIYNSQI